ncbi:MAG: hypothetical protein JWN40_465 [Phycisphaerales bacterium]|nr:hypothetical protein [Phycisphaerales bacterium]
MSRRLRLSRGGHDRLSPHAMNGSGELGKLGPAQSTYGAGRIEMQRGDRLPHCDRADSQLLRYGRHRLARGLVGSQMLPLGKCFNDPLRTPDGEKTQIGLVHGPIPVPFLKVLARSYA